jgi:hypothetical protein
MTDQSADRAKPVQFLSIQGCGFVGKRAGGLE